MVNIVFACTGNMCRSPIAEGILRSRWKLSGRDDLSVSSMGTHAPENEPATELACQVCAEHGIDISSHRSRQLVYDEMTLAHLILVMEKRQKEYICTFFPRIADKVFLLGAWPDDSARKSEIADPVGKPINTYRRAFDTIASHIDRIFDDLIDYFG